MPLRRVLPVVCLAVFSAGCMTAEKQRAADEAKCRSYGFSTRNDAFAECLQRIDLAREYQSRYGPNYGPAVVYRP